MNFFEEQARAQRQTTRIVCLFPLAAISLCLLFYGFLFLFSVYLKDPGYIYGFHLNFFYLSAMVISAVLAGSLYKIQQLKAGGRVVAEALGGVLLATTELPPAEQRLRNIVEEMAIASGTPKPAIYILEEPSINAFAAGLTPQDAVIGVTRGAVTLLSRDELQGVIAHEFSHILYGDMRLNTRLVGILHGILIISLTGYKILQALATQREAVRATHSKRTDQIPLPMVLFAFILLICGAIGAFFASLIKNAVSHQREFLADATAVKLTRNPSGIADALKKIGGYQSQTPLIAERAAEFSHMYFSCGVSTLLRTYTTTHPPLKERIARIEPNWNGEFITIIEPAGMPEAPEKSEMPAQVSPGIYSAFSGLAGTESLMHIAADVPGFNAEHLLRSTASLQKEHLTTARTLLQRLPEPLKDAARDPENAQILAYLLLLHPQKDQREAQLQRLQPRVLSQAFDRLRHLHQQVPVIDKNHRLPLVDLAIPSLRECSSDQTARFLENLHHLAETDRRISLMEWCLIHILESSLQKVSPERSQYQLADVSQDIAILLSTLAYAGAKNEAQAQQALSHAGKILYPILKQELKLTKISHINSINTALNRLKALFPLQKPLLLKAMVQSVSHDNHVSAAEAELLRAVASSIDCPLPPFPAQELAA